MDDVLKEFSDFLAHHGIIPPSEIIADGKFHRAATTERPKKLDASYKLFLDNHPAGGCCNFRSGSGRFYTWSSSKKELLSDEERKALAEKVKQLRRDGELLRVEQQKEGAEKARAFWEGSTDCLNHPYLEKKKVKSHGLRVNGDKLVIPIYENGEIISCQTIDAAGKKKFTAGAKKKGGSFTIYGDNTILLCEGYATGASLYEATGHTVIVGFDAGNLETLCKSHYILCADNDAASSANTGLITATKIKRETGCRVVYPDSPDGKSIDFNDISHEEIRLIIHPNEIEYEPTMSVGEAPFKALGYDDGMFFYYSNAGRQVISLSAANHTKLNLLRLAPLQYWDENYSKNWDMAANSLIAFCYEQGVYDPERVRGRGAWYDKGRVVVHMGDQLVVHGSPIPLNKIKSFYIYEAKRPMSVQITEPCLNLHAHRLVDLCTRLSWENPLSGYLLAGWCVIAPICGILKWRPHIWITGSSSSGKSTVVNDIVRPLIGNFAISVDGSTTEASIRQEMGHDARPVIFDEADSSEQSGRQRIRGIIELARTSSSGGVIGKGGADGKSKRYAVRGCFMFSSINTLISEYSDETRFSRLVLRKDVRVNAAEHYAGIAKEINNLITQDFADGMFSRSVENILTIQENIKVFTNVSGQYFRNRRIADQIGAILGGLYLCYSIKSVTPEQASAFLARNAWADHTAMDSPQDELKLVERIVTSRIRFDTDRGAKEVTIGEAILVASGHSGVYCDFLSPSKAADELGKYGIKVTNETFIVANDCTPMRWLLKDTAWVNSWGTSLRQIKTSKKIGPMYYSPGINQRGTELPIELIFSKEAANNGAS